MDTSSSGLLANGSESKLFEFQQALLVKEIEYIHSQISHFDDLSFQIKGWAVAIWSAIAAFGAQQNAPLVVLASIPAISTFWILDGFFKQYQRRLMSRAGVIATFLDSRGFFKEKGLHAAFEQGDFGHFPLYDPIAGRTRKLGEEFDKKYRERTNYWKAFTISNVSYFYLLLIVSAIAMVLLLI